MDEVTWAALTALLTVLGAGWTVHAFRRRGLGPGLRGAGLTLLPPAAWLTGTLEMFTEIGGSVVDWATGLVLSPAVWAGVVLAGLSAALLAASTTLGRREPDHDRSGAQRPPDGRAASAELSAKTHGDALLEDDLSDVEAILKRRGIT